MFLDGVFSEAGITRTYWLWVQEKLLGAGVGKIIVVQVRVLALLKAILY